MSVSSNHWPAPFVLPGCTVVFGDPETGLPYNVIGMIDRGIEDAVESIESWRKLDLLDVKIADLTERLHPRR